MTAAIRLGGAPLQARIPLVLLGTLLMLQAGRMLTAARRRPRSRLAGATVWCSVRVCRRTGLLRRDDDDLLAARLAAAPSCWPARAVAAGVSAAHEDVVLSEVMPGVRLTSAIAFAALAATSATMIGTPTAAVTATGAALVGAALPDIVLRRAARAARRAACDNTASAVDVLAAALSAGMPLRDALELTVGHAPPSLAASLRAAALGGATGLDLRTAFIAEGDRFGIPALADVGDALDRQRRLGTPLGPELARIAARLRSEERARLAERAARRGPLATLLVALVIAPACLAALTACLIGGVVESGTLGLR